MSSGPGLSTVPSGGVSSSPILSPANDFEISIKGASIIGGNLNIVSGTIKQGTNPVTNISIDQSGKLTTAVPVASVSSTSFISGQIVIYTNGSAPSAYALMVDDKSYKVIDGFPFDINSITSGSGTASVNPDLTFVLDASSGPVIYTDLSLIKPAQITTDLQLRQYAILLANGYNDVVKDGTGGNETIFLTSIENLNINVMSVADANNLIAAGKADGIWTDGTNIPGIVNPKVVAPVIGVKGGSRRPRTARRRYRRRYSRRFRRY